MTFDVKDNSNNRVIFTYLYFRYKSEEANEENEQLNHQILEYVPAFLTQTYHKQTDTSISVMCKAFIIPTVLKLMLGGHGCWFVCLGLTSLLNI